MEELLEQRREDEAFWSSYYNGIYSPTINEIIKYAFEKAPALFRECVETCDNDTTVTELLRDFGSEHREYIEDYCGGI